jgi:hypothetical protein
MKTRAGVLGALLAVGLISSNAANANLITFYGSYDSPPAGPQITYDADDDRGTLLCGTEASLSCEGLLSDLPDGIYDPNVPGVDTADGFDSSAADLFVIGSSSDAAELAFVNAALAAYNTSVSSGTKTDVNQDSYTFTSSALYILFKIGTEPNYALIHNTTGGAVTYDYSALRQEGAGLSHITEFGGTVSVPEPHTSLLLGAGLLAMAFTWRRKKAKA